MRFKKFLLGIKPTKKGTLALCLCLFIIPLIADLFLVFAGGTLYNRSVSVTLPLANAYIRALPLLIVYLIIYYFIASAWKDANRR